jgi:cytochrome c peroxidase
MRTRACTVALIFCASPALIAQPDSYQWNLPKGFPKPSVPADNSMSAVKVELGRYLFYDKRLSVNGESSCATCHRQQLAFTDGRKTAAGTTGQLHSRNSMSLVNVAYSAALTWSNPELRRLEDQALVPMFGERPVELGLRETDDSRGGRCGPALPGSIRARISRRIGSHQRPQRGEGDCRV